MAAFLLPAAAGALGIGLPTLAAVLGEDEYSGLDPMTAAILRQQDELAQMPGGGEFVREHTSTPFGPFERMRQEEEARRKAFIANATGRGLTASPSTSSAPSGPVDPRAIALFDKAGTQGHTWLGEELPPNMRDLFSAVTSVRSTNPTAWLSRGLIGQKELNEHKDAVIAEALGKEEVARANAARGINALDKRGAMNYEQAYKDILAGNQRATVDMFRGGEGYRAPIMQALVELGPKLLARGQASDIGEFGTILNKVGGDAQSRLDTARKEKLLEGITGLEMKGKDFNAKTDVEKQRLAFEDALEAAKIHNLSGRSTAANVMLTDAQKRRQEDNQLRVANSNNRPTELQQLLEVGNILGKIDAKEKVGPLTEAESRVREILKGKIKQPKAAMSPKEAADVRVKAMERWPSNPALAELEFQYMSGGMDDKPDQQRGYFAAVAAEQKK